MSDHPVDSSRFPLTRRTFLWSSAQVAASLWLASRGVSLAAAQEGEYSAGNFYPLNPLADFVGSYAAPSGDLILNRPCALQFDLIGWEKKAFKKGKSALPGGEKTVVLLGALHIERLPQVDKIVYRLKRTLETDSCEMEIVCRPDRWESVKTWKATYGNSLSQTNGVAPLVATGSVEGGKIQWHDGAVLRQISCPGLLLADAALLFNAGKLADMAAEGNEFCRLDQEGLPRIAQRFGKSAEAGGAPGKKPLSAWLLTGRATMPSHFIYDAQGRPLFFTGLLVSAALKTIA